MTVAISFGASPVHGSEDYCSSSPSTGLVRVLEFISWLKKIRMCFLQPGVSVKNKQMTTT